MLHIAQSYCLALYCEVISPRLWLPLYPLDMCRHLLVLAAQKKSNNDDDDVADNTIFGERNALYA